MSRADSPLLGRMMFNVGARRSGTLWLQRLLTAHPAISSLRTETYLFSYGISQVFDRLQHGIKSSPRVASVYAEREPVLDATRDLCDTIFAPHLEPGARWLVERTPWHGEHLRLIAEIYPDARFLHIIRDGRDVARSLVAQPWGPETIGEAAEEWRHTVSAARAAALPPESYREVRYEQLLAEPIGGVTELWEWLGVEPTPPAEASLSAEVARAENLGPDARVAAGKWRDEWGAAELREFERAGGELLAELGYERQEARGRTRRRRWRSWQRSAPPSPEPPRADRPPLGATAAQRLPELLLGAIRLRDAEAASRLLSDNARVRILRGGILREGVGTAGRSLLAEWLAEDEALEGRQLVGEIRPSIPFSTVWLALEHDGRQETRVLLLASDAGEIEEITIAAPTDAD